MTTPATSPGVFFSFPRVTDPSRHADYNAWHSYDHRPENLALPGVVHGDRWVRSPDCVASGPAADPLLAPAQYLAMYWFADPLEASVAAWQQLGDTTLQQGRRPDLRYTTRPLLGFFRPVRPYLAPGTRVSAAALPFRPHRGVHVTVTAVDDPRSAAADEQFRWQDQEWIPRALSVAGAVGAWTFRSERLSAGSTGAAAEGALPTARITLVWVDDDPVAYAGRLAEAERGWRGEAPAPRPEVERTLLRSPLRSITPGEWNWFDGPDDAGS